MAKINEQLLFPHAKDEIQEILAKLNKSKREQFHNVFTSVNDYPNKSQKMQYAGLYAIKYLNRTSENEAETNHTALCLGDGTIILSFEGLDSAFDYNELCTFIEHFSGAGKESDEKEINRLAEGLRKELDKDNVKYGGVIENTEDYQNIVSMVNNQNGKFRQKQYNKVRTQLIEALASNQKLMEKLPEFPRALFEQDQNFIKDLMTTYEDKQLAGLEAQKPNAQKRGIAQLNKQLEWLKKFAQKISPAKENEEQDLEI